LAALAQIILFLEMLKLFLEIRFFLKENMFVKANEESFEILNEYFILN
jgi:hypothetical protein